MNKKLRKSILTYGGIVLFFVVLAFGFVPQVLQGEVLNQSDITGFMGMAREANQWNIAHPDDKTAWTGSMFSGMPTIMVTGNPDGDWTQFLFKWAYKGRPASFLLISLLGAFLLMLALGMGPVVAAAGAVAVTFCSYNMQILQVGHNSKMLALAYMPWVLAAVVFTYRKALRDEARSWKEWLPATVFGAALFAFALAAQIKANHVQITYYLAIIIFSYVLVLIIWLLTDSARRKKFGRFIAASALLLVLGVTGIATNANRLIPTWSYSKQTMRGGSELSADADGAKTKGLDLDYATAWSYGWEELPNLMIPNFNGGSSAGSLPMDSETVQLLRKAGQPNLRQIAKSLPLYWGPQPFTAGPMYMGAITLFLFFLSLCLYKGKEKWWILIPTVIGVLLALGNHFLPFTKFWYDHMPFYSKFRTVSMALVILQVTLPALGFLVLDRIVKGSYERKEFLRSTGIAFALTGGFCLLCWLFPSIAGDFSSASDAGMQDILADALRADRAMLLRRDALTSLIFIALTALLLYWACLPRAEKEAASAGRRQIAAMAIGVLVVLNMFTVGKRYLNKDHFFTPTEQRNLFTARTVDKKILQDPLPSYRVLDFTSNIFNDSFASYYHKNIGGYSPVKLQRYQDLIDRYISPEANRIVSALQSAATIQDFKENQPEIPIISMLNGKYFIIGAEADPLTNEKAFGNAWFTDTCAVAATPAEEIGLLGKVDLHRCMVLGPDFAATAASLPAGSAADPADTIRLTSYAPNELHYHYRASAPRSTVFSEIYYPQGWTAKLEDGTPLPLFRTNWTLRGAVLPAGEHDIVMRFEPRDYTVSSNISRASSISLILIILLATGAMIAIRKKQD